VFQWLKRNALPVWNRAHHYGRLGLLYENAVRQKRFESCAVCEHFRPMLYHPRIIPDRLVELWGLTPELTRSFARKESCFCSYCGANLRARRLAQVMLWLWPVGKPATPSRSLATWLKRPERQSLRIAEINRIDGLHQQLAGRPNVSTSDFHPGAARGALNNGVRSEDLMNLTYPDQSFDIVLTSETLEHVPDLPRALSEIRRVLVPGGRHVFTVPQLPHVPRTFARSLVMPDGSIQDVHPPICHPGGDLGYPVFTEFGTDLDEVMERAGYEIQTFFGPNRVDDVAQVYVARKVSDG
jgi:hypothetical protein